MSSELNYYQKDPKFRCCCQFCHVRKGTMAVAIASIVFACYFLIKSLAFFGRNRDDYRATTVLTFLVAIVWLAASIVLLIGLLRELPVLLVPFMVVQVPIILLSAALGILCLIYLVLGRPMLLAPTGASDREPRTLQSHEDHLHMMILVGVQALVYGLAFAFGIWFYITVLQCYRWLKEMKTQPSVDQQFNMNIMREPPEQEFDVRKSRPVPVQIPAGRSGVAPGPSNSSGHVQQGRPRRV